MSSWEAIRHHTFLDSISVTVTEAVHHDREKLDWRLTVEDSSGKQFEVEISKKHNPLTNWEEGAEYEIQNGYGQTWDEGRRKKLHSSKKWSAERIDSSPDCKVMVMGDSHIGKRKHSAYPYSTVDCAGKFKQAISVAVDRNVDYILHTGDVFDDSATKEDRDTADRAFQMMEEE